jgi:ferric-dicitrate binding protein FerR (iron transport regulator)
MTSEERQKLKNRIFESIRAYDKRRSLWMYSSVAASIALIAGFMYFYSIHSFNDLPAAYHTAAAEDFENITDVVLQLSEDEKVLIKDDSSRIEYSSADHAIKISDSKTIRKEELAANAYNTLIVPYGKRSEIILSDGTKVWLNSGSKLVYPSFFSGSKREVFLIGEAIFDVSENKEKPFYVSTNDYVVKVLGTVFNISNYPDDAFTSTVLKSGLVQIDYREKGPFKFKKSIELLPGNKATYERSNDKLVTSAVNVDPYFSWKDGVLMFKNDPLENIIKRVSRYYNVEVTITSEELKHERFSGHLNLKDDIIQVIEVINESAGQVFEIERMENDKSIKLTKI